MAIRNVNRQTSRNVTELVAIAELDWSKYLWWSSKLVRTFTYSSLVVIVVGPGAHLGQVRYKREEQHPQAHTISLTHAHSSTDKNTYDICRPIKSYTRTTSTVTFLRLYDTFWCHLRCGHGMFLFLFFPSYSLLLSSFGLVSFRNPNENRRITNTTTRLANTVSTVSNSTILSLSFFKFFRTNHRQWTNREWIFAEAVLPRKRRTTALPPAGSLSGLDSAPLYVTLHDNYPSALEPSNLFFPCFSHMYYLLASLFNDRYSTLTPSRRQIEKPDADFLSLIGKLCYISIKMQTC